jgi:hypothetical protein
VAQQTYVGPDRAGSIALAAAPPPWVGTADVGSHSARIAGARTPTAPRNRGQRNATDLTLTAASAGSAEDHDQSSGAARSRRPPEQIAHTVPSGAATNNSIMSGIGM